MSNITKSEGYINDVAFQLSGPSHLIDAIKNYIRNLTKMHGGLKRESHKETITTTVQGN